jgi:hypothetical protein
MTEATATRPGITGCLLCCHPVELAQPQCPAFALAGIRAHAGCCGGCATTALARREPATGRTEAVA